MRLLVTYKNFLSSKQTYLAIKRVLPRAEVRGSGFKGVFLVEVEGDPFEAAKALNRCSAVGRAVPLLVEVASDVESVKQAALRVSELLSPAESFCFRLYKRGAHKLDKPTPEIEREVGAAIQMEVERRKGRRPEVDLENPDVEISAEVLGPVTHVGILRESHSRKPRTPPHRPAS